MCEKGKHVLRHESYQNFDLYLVVLALGVILTVCFLSASARKVPFLGSPRGWNPWKSWPRAKLPSLLLLTTL